MNAALIELNVNQPDIEHFYNVLYPIRIHYYKITKLQEQQHPMKDVHSIKVSVSAIVFSIQFTQIH